MALDDLLNRLQSESVTPVTRQQNDGVTTKPVPLLAVTPVSPVTPRKSYVTTKTDAGTEKPLPVTAQYFRTQGVDLLADDVAFLRWTLPKDTAGRNESIKRYISIWLEAADSEPVPRRKINRGRFAANTWLRERHERTRAIRD